MAAQETEPSQSLRMGGRPVLSGPFQVCILFAVGKCIPDPDRLGEIPFPVVAWRGIEVNPNHKGLASLDQGQYPTDLGDAERASALKDVTVQIVVFGDLDDVDVFRRP